MGCTGGCFGKKINSTKKTVLSSPYRSTSQTRVRSSASTPAVKITFGRRK